MKRLLGILLSLTLMFSLMPKMSMMAYAAVPDKVYYRVYDYSDGKLTYTDKEIAGTGVTEVTNSTTEWADGTYVVPVTTTISSRITVTGTVNLIIFDGATLTAEKGITVSNSNTLNIYMGNSSNSITGTGTLIAKPYSDNSYGSDPDDEKYFYGASIGGYYIEDFMRGDDVTKKDCGTINIHGGTIIAQKGNNNYEGSGISGAIRGTGGTVSIYYSNVTAYGDRFSSAIGGGRSNGSGGTVAIYGSNVNAIVYNNPFGYDTSGIGKGEGSGNNGTLTVGKDVAVYALKGEKTPDVDLTGETNVAPEGGGQVTIFNNSMFTRYTGPAPTPPHTHSFTYAASGATITATCTAGGCDLPPSTTGGTDHVAKLSLVAPTLTTYAGTGDATATLDGVADFNTATGKTIATTDIKYVGRGSTTYAESSTAPTNAGTYTAKITVEGKTASLNYEIAKADPTANAPTGLSATYGQTLSEVTLTNPAGNTNGTWAWVAAGTTSVGNAGDNTFKANFTPTDANYKTVENVDVTITVDKAANPATVTGTATVIKGGNTVDLKDNVTMNGAMGDVGYAFDGEAKGCTLSGSILTSGNTTGTVTVNVTVAADSNYKALAAKPITVTINDKGTQTITAADVTASYGDTDKSVSASVTDPAQAGGAISYAVKDGSADYIDVNASTGALTIKKVPADGKAYVVVTAAETAVYAQATKDVTVTISKANAVPATVTANNRTYDGTEKPLVNVTGKATGGTMNYAIGSDATTAPTKGWGTSIPAKTNAGTYYVWYKAAGDEDHQDSEPACIVVNIRKADLDLSVSISDWEAGTEAPAPVLAGNSGNGKVTYTYAVRDSEEFTNTVPTAAGEYTLKASVAETANYETAEATCDFKISEAVHQHTFGTNPRWQWRFIDGKAYAEAVYSCDCGETKTVSATVKKDDGSSSSVTYTATDKDGKTDTRSFNKTFTVTYRDESTVYAYGATCTLTAEEDSDWMVTPEDGNEVVRAVGTKTFYFPVTENVTVKAEKNAAAQEQSARIGVLSQAGGQNQFTYKVFWSLPEGAQVKSTMIYRSKDNGFTFKTAGDLLAAPTLRSYNMKLNVRNGEFKYTAVNLTSGTKQTVMAQVVYSLKGQTYTIHTTPVSIEIQ